MFRRAAGLILLGLAASAAADAETSPTLEALSGAKQVLWETVFDPSVYAEGLHERPQTRIEMRYHGDDYDYPVAALALTYAREPDCVAALRQAAVRPPDACPFGWRAHVVRAPEPESNQYPGLRPRWRGSALEARLAAQPALMEAGAETIIAALDIEHLILEEAGCLEAQPDLAGLVTVSPVQKSYSELFDPAVEFKGLGGLYLHADTVSVRVESYAGVLEASGVPEAGRVTGWARDLLLAFDPCFEKAGFGPLWRPAPD